MSDRTLGIRKEDKNIWERRVPVIPSHLEKIIKEENIHAVVEPFERRAFTDDEYRNAGAELSSDLSECKTVVAVKEIPVNLLQPEKNYVFFSHTIKGQEYNMPLLKRLMELKCTLIDYECIADEKGRRLVFFGRFAGLAGMIEALYGMGQRYKSKGIETPFLKIKQAYQYRDVDEAKKHIAEIAEEIKSEGLNKELDPLVIGFAGYGNVSRGAQEIFDILPYTEISPDELLSVKELPAGILKVVFKEKDMVENIESGKDFELQEYYNHPERYKSKFEPFLERMDVLINAIYWTEKYPVFLSKKYLKENYDKIKLGLVGDITCDINGTVEFTYKATMPDVPGFIYNPLTDNFTDGFEGEGIVDITIDNLPTELPRDSSVEFSDAFSPFVPSIVKLDDTVPFDECKLPPEIKRAVILYKGELTPDYKYIEKFIK